MAEIKVLDPHTAELIAAGEVVERPSSVVKELAENSIDAGATSVTVSIERGGTAMIQIADNGCGIEAESIPTAFIRHATSKIRTEDDLETIGTLGFRGEALPSVASVSRVELLTKTEQDEYAYCYRISGGVEEGIEPGARPVGTTITVRDLFYNTPARMKFLKKDTSEGNYVSDVVIHLALSHPEVSFKYVRDGKVQFQTPGDGRLMSAAYAALSRDFAKDLVEVNHTHGYYTVRGLVTPPKSSRASRSMQFFFINGRYIKNRTMMAALEAAYKGVMMQGKFPGCVLTVDMPPQLVDVNVHPAKTEVRFARERDVFDAVYQAVKCVLITPQSTEKTFSFREAGASPAAEKAPAAQPGAAPAAPAPAAERSAALEKERFFAAAEQPVRAVPAKNITAAPTAGEVRAYNEMISALNSEPAVPYRTAKAPDIWADENEVPTPEPVRCTVLPHKGSECPQSGENAEAPEHPDGQKKESAAEAPSAPVWEEASAATEQPVEESAPQTAVHQTAFAPFEEEEQRRPLRFVGEVFDTYIVTQRGDDMCLLDKHAAHERIIFESLAAHYGHVSSQMLLVPVTIALSAEEKNALMQSAELLQDSGLEVDDFGGNSVVVRAVPADVVPEDVEDLVVELASRLVSNPRYTTSEKTEWVLHSIACRAAVKAGDKSHAAQLLRLAEDVLDGKVPPFCPHGRPVVLKITKKELEKQFGRQG